MVWWGGRVREYRRGRGLAVAVGKKGKGMLKR